jgi:hypothetical protein
MRRAGLPTLAIGLRINPYEFRCNAQEGGSALEMDGSKGQPKMTAGLDLGDKYSYLCLIDTESGEVIEEGRLRTTPETFRRRFYSEQQPPLRIAIADLLMKCAKHDCRTAEKDHPVSHHRTRGSASPARYLPAALLGYPDGHRVESAATPMGSGVLRCGRAARTSREDTWRRSWA